MPGRGRPAVTSRSSTAGTWTRHRKGWPRPSGSPRTTRTTAGRACHRRPARSCWSTATSSSRRSTAGCAASSCPSLGAGNVVVLAGRDPPTAPWQTDPGWRQLVAVHRLEPFDPAESAELLAHAGVAPQAWAHLVTLGRGHPLTMALLADLAASGEVPGALADAPDLISALLESFLRDVPSEAHLIGLATCATAWLTTEDLLRGLVGADAPAVWQWLARRPFVTAGRAGCSPTTWPATCWMPSSNAARPSGTARIAGSSTTMRWPACAPPPASTGSCTPNRCLPAAAQPARQRDLRAAGARLAPRSSRPARRSMSRSARSRTVRRTGQRRHSPAPGSASSPTRSAWCAPATASPGSPTTRVCPSGSALEDHDPVVRAVLDHVARDGADPSRGTGRHPPVLSGAGPPTRPYAVLAASVSHHHRVVDPPARLVVHRR